MDEAKQISPWLATAIGLGAIIGAGIFVLSGSAVAIAGSSAIIAFLLVGVVVLLIALQFGELGSILPKEKGASYSYVYDAFGSELGFITGLLLYFSYATAISAISLGFGSYASSLFSLTFPGAQYVLAILLIAVLSIVNLFGIKRAAKYDASLVIVKVLILCAFIVFALWAALAIGGANSAITSLTSSPGGISAILAASVAIIFAYSGFQTISTFTANVKGGPNSAAKAIIIAVLISMVLYILVIVALLLLAPPSTYGLTADPLSFALTAAHAPQWLFVAVDIGAMIATASAVLAMILAGSRILYQISSDGLLPKVFRKFNSARDVAQNGIIVSAVIGVIMLFSGNVYVIAAISNFGLLFSYLMSSFALIHFRRAKRPASFVSPFYPYIGLFTIVVILLFMAGMPQESLVIGVILVLSLIIIYYFLREAEQKRVVKVRLFR